LALPIVILNFPAMYVAMVAVGNAHDPTGQAVVFVLAAALQWVGIASLFVRRKVPSRES
jgi:hypothetical protein